MDFANAFPCLFTRRRAVWRRRETSGKGSMPPPRPLRPLCVTPRYIRPATGIPPLHGFCKYLSLPFPRCGAAWRRETSGKGSMPQPPVGLLPPEIQRGSHWLPRLSLMWPIWRHRPPVRTPTGCAGCRTSARRCPRIFVPAGGGESSWWGSAPRSRCSRGS